MCGVTLLAIVLASTAAALSVRPAAGQPVASTGRSSRPRARAILLATGVVGAGAALAVLDGTSLFLALIALGAALGVVGLWRRGRRRRERDRRQLTVVEVSEALADELRAGRPPVAALERCAELWSDFQPVVAAGRLNADVPAALRRLAAMPGAEGLSRLASAWQVSERSGAALSDVLLQVAESARARQASARLVHAELASAEATARLVTVLPLATLAMSSGVGASPWAFLLGEPVGLACLALGTALLFLGLWWIDRIAVAVTRS